MSVDEQHECPNPYKPEDCRAWNHILQSIHGTIELCKAGIAAGLPCEDYLNQNGNQKRMIEYLKGKFFPNMP